MANSKPEFQNTADTIVNLNLQDKQSIVDMLFQVDAGFISVRRAASEIVRAATEDRISVIQRIRKLLSELGS